MCKKIKGYLNLKSRYDFFKCFYDKKNIFVVLIFLNSTLNYVSSEWETIFLNTSTKRVYVPKPLIKKI